MAVEPLASRIRPATLEDYIGQSHLVSPGKPIYVAIQQGRLFSMLLWGPPGVGKTTLARIYAAGVGAHFVELSAVAAGKRDVRDVVEMAAGQDVPTVLFLDEIHRFNKAQQDFLLPSVEQGIITLIGATTENPSFEVIAPLLSRCRVFVLNRLEEDEILQVVERAVDMVVRDGLLASNRVDEDVGHFLVELANGDARRAINVVENTASLYGELTVETLKQALQSMYLNFDKAGDEHYNVISAYIKSMRASNVDAALYYLARMVESGEDPKFIARRMVIFASEDVGMAQPTALVVANEVFRAVETIGYPECAINLAHGTAYLALCKKDRRAYTAYFRAVEDVKRYGNLTPPLSILNAPTALMREQGYGQGYQAYTSADLLPDKLKGNRYYDPPPKDKES